MQTSAPSRSIVRLAGRDIAPTILLLATSVMLLTAVGGALSAQTCVPHPNGLRGWWPMDEAGGQMADDVSQRGIHPGVLVGTTPVAGVSGNARRFDLASDLMKANGGGALDIGGNQITLAAWIRLEPHNTTTQVFAPVFGKRTFPDGQTYMMLFEGGAVGGTQVLPPDRWRFEYIFTNSSGTRVHNQATGVNVLADLQFHHYAVTYDGSTIRLWVDAVQQASFGFSGNLKRVPNVTVDVRGDRPFSIDDAQVFDRALTGAELAAIVAAGSAGQCPPPPPEPACMTPPPGLVGWWSLDETSGTTAADLSDTGADATLVGTSAVAGHVSGARRLVPGDQIVASGVGPLDVSGAAITLDAWIRLEPNPTPESQVFTGQMGKTTDPHPYFMLFEGGRIGGTLPTIGPDKWQFEYLFNNSTGTRVHNQATDVLVFVDGRYHHFALVYGSGTVRLYVDGIQRGSFPFSGNLLSRPTEPVRAVASHPYSLDEFEIFDRALSAAEVLALFQAGAAGKCKGAPPVADAGPDQTVDESTLVTLDGTGSTGGTPLDYAWLQLAGTPVLLSDAGSAQSGFVAPAVPVGGETLSFQLVVSSGGTDSDPDVVNVIVKNVNNPPVADAGGDLVVSEDALVALDGGGSFDPDDEALTYAWVQLSGPLVALFDDTSATPSFMAPLVGAAGASLSFELTVSDGLDTDSDVVDVAVVNVNQRPVADAGVDATHDEGSHVALDGSASNDVDGDALLHSWMQTSGPAVALDLTDPVRPTFSAPLVGLGGAVLTFELMVSDGDLLSLPDEVVVHVRNANDPPLCGAARVADLWPPNHKLVPITIQGVSDPDSGDTVTLTILSVTQDEPVDGTGDGDTSPDAVIEDGQLFLRAERTGNGNGRVYRVTFLADDGLESCTGTVDIHVRHSQKKSGVAVDDGQVYGSL